MPKFLLSGVAAATSSLHANLKGVGQDDTPLRKREHHLRNRMEDGSHDSGLNLVVPIGQVGSTAPPDIITSDLEAYTKGILKTRERDLDIMGARRISSLWSGANDSHAKGFRGKGVLRRRHDSIDETDEGGRMGPLGKIGEKTGLAIKGGLGLVRWVLDVDWAHVIVAEEQLMRLQTPIQEVPDPIP